MYPYQDKDRPLDERVEDLLARMTTEEKILQTDLYAATDFSTTDKDGRVESMDLDKMAAMLRGHSAGCMQLRSVSPAQANAIQRWAVEKTRLGIPFLFSEEALHGLYNAGATSFPQQIGLAASFDPALGRAMGHAIAAEARACGIHETYSPVMDLIRDPRYGRGEESYGEDTYLCGEFARETVKGMQGDDLRAPDAVAAEPKHYVGYGMPVAGLNCAPTAMGRHEVFSDCLPVFEQAFREGGACNAMCSYNAIDGVPVSMDHELLTDVLRGQFGMRGFVRADMTAVSRLYDWHFIAETPREAVRLLRCPDHLALARQIARESIVLLKNDGLLPLDPHTRRVAVIGPGAAQAMLGDYTETRGREGAVSILEGIRAVVSPETRVEYAQGCHFLGQELRPLHQSMLEDEEGNMGLTGRYYNGPTPKGKPVLTRSDRAINFNWIFAMPDSHLNANCFSAAWTGTMVMPRSFDGYLGLSTQDSMRLYIDGELLIDGWGPGKSADRAVPFHFEGGRRYAVRIEFVNDGRGARVIFGYSEGGEDIEAAAALAARSDVAILCLGDNEETSGENFDRVSLDLPGRQLELARAVYATGTPVVLVLQSGRPVSANWENEHLPAILEAWFPGEQGGAAVAETLFGLNNPSGRLPITFPRHVGQVPCHYTRRPGGGKKYVEMDWQPLWPFGYGLGYTTFAYSELKLSASVIGPEDSITVTVRVENTGARPGTAVPQLYIHDAFASVVKPRRHLGGFARVELQPGESRTVRFEVGPRQLRTLGADYVWRVEPGRFEIQLGDNAENILLTAPLTVAQG